MKYGFYQDELQWLIAVKGKFQNIIQRDTKQDERDRNFDTCEGI